MILATLNLPIKSVFHDVISLTMLKPIGNSFLVTLSPSCSFPLSYYSCNCMFPSTSVFFLMSLLVLVSLPAMSSPTFRASITYLRGLFWCHIYAGSLLGLPWYLPVSPPLYLYCVMVNSLCLFPPPDRTTWVSELHAIYLYISTTLHSAWFS